MQVFLFPEVPIIMREPKYGVKQLFALPPLYFGVVVQLNDAEFPLSGLCYLSGQSSKLKQAGFLNKLLGKPSGTRLTLDILVRLIFVLLGVDPLPSNGAEKLINFCL